MCKQQPALEATVSPAFSQPSRGAPEEGGASSHPKAPPSFSTLRTTPSPFREANGTEEGRSLEKTFPVGQRSDAVVCQQEIWEAVGRGSRALRRKVSGPCLLFLFLKFVEHRGKMRGRVQTGRRGCGSKSKPSNYPSNLLTTSLHKPRNSSRRPHLRQISLEGWSALRQVPHWSTVSLAYKHQRSCKRFKQP